METVELIKLVEQSQGIVEGTAQFYLFLLGAITVVSIGCIAYICYQREVTEAGLLKLVVWFFLASPATFYLASGALAALSSYQEAYVQSLWHKYYGEQAFTTLDWNVLWSQAQRVATGIDFELVMKLELYKFVHGFFKFFVPALLAALGAWSLVRYMDARVRVVSAASGASKYGAASKTTA